MEQTLVLLKPDALQRDLVVEIISRLEHKGLMLVGLKMMHLSDSLLNEHYSHLVGRDFFPEVKSFMQLTPVVACCWQGTDAVDTVRLLCGITKARGGTRYYSWRSWHERTGKPHSLLRFSGGGSGGG